jgi:hypothetical protein
MDEGDGGSWEELRKEALKIEGDLDVKLSSYNKLGGMLAHGGCSFDDPCFLCRDLPMEVVPLVILFFFCMLANGGCYFGVSLHACPMEVVPLVIHVFLCMLAHGVCSFGDPCFLLVFCCCCCCSPFPLFHAFCLYQKAIT